MQSNRCGCPIAGSAQRLSGPQYGIICMGATCQLSTGMSTSSGSTALGRRRLIAQWRPELAAKEPSFRWSVKNQAWMHVRNGELPYESTEDAVRRWPETATAIAVRWSRSELEILAPFGLSDLFSMIVRPTPSFVGDKFPFFIERVRNKRWLERWPMLSLAEVTGRPE